jgi:ABC-2 type transport system ATP-binding protein
LIQSAEAPWAVELARFSKRYRPSWTGGSVAAVRDLSLGIRRGEVFGLLGPNGSGKSTTLKALAGLVAPTSGECWIHGFPAGTPAACRLCGYLPESPRFAPHQTGLEFLRFCAALAGLNESAVATALAACGLPAGDDRPLATYSKGMMQRLALAQAILGEPAVLLLDEPASGLDPEGRRMLAGLIRERRARGTTIVFSSHLLAHAATWCDRIAILGRGQLLALGSPAEIAGLADVSTDATSRLEEIYLATVARHDA